MRSGHGLALMLKGAVGQKKSAEFTSTSGIRLPKHLGLLHNCKSIRKKGVRDDYWCVFGVLVDWRMPRKLRVEYEGDPELGVRSQTGRI
jgi:hypothetical protein